MRLVSYWHQDREGVGILDHRGLTPIADYPDLLSLLEAGALDKVRDDTRSAQIDPLTIEWLPPITRPRKILCVGINYHAHRIETGRDETPHPTFFTRFSDTLVGQRGQLVRPKVSARFDFEGELAVVIGRSGRHISEKDALGHVAGYACFNDASVRDWQRHTSQFTPGKNFPETGGFGPWLVTTDEVPDPRALGIRTRLNGEIVQESNTELMIFGIERLIAYASTFTPLSPGDIIATGTPSGVGDKRDPPLYLKPGDTIEVEIDGVGTLVNGVVDE